MSWSPQRSAQSAATLRALEERLGAEESRSERAEVRAVFLEVRLGAAERAVEKASLALSPDRVRGCLTERLTTERICRDEAEEHVSTLEQQVADAEQVVGRHGPASLVASQSGPLGSAVSRQLAVAEARAASLEQERLALRGRLAASDARAEAMAERDALQRELVAERVEREQAEAEAETLELRQRLVLAEQARQESQEVRRLRDTQEQASEELPSANWEPPGQPMEPLAARPSVGDREQSLQEENAMLRSQLLSEGRRRGRLEARLAALERERDKLWEQLTGEEARRIQVEAQAAAFEREWDAVRERLAAEQLRRERAEEERNSLLHSPAGRTMSQPDSPWRWQLSVDEQTLEGRLATEEARREAAEERAIGLKDDLSALSERLAGLEAGIGMSPLIHASSSGSNLDGDTAPRSLPFTELLPNERARLEWAEERVLTLERQLAEATHSSRPQSENATGFCILCRRRLDGQLDTTLDTRASTPDRSLPMADRVAAQHQALLPWKDCCAPHASLGDSERSDTDLLKEELALARSSTEQRTNSLAQERKQLAAKVEAQTNRANVEAAEAAVLREKLSKAEFTIAQRTRRAVHEENTRLKDHFEPLVENMQKQIDSHQRATASLREELAAEGDRRARDFQELCLLRDRLANTELDAAAQRAMVGGRAALQQQLAPIVQATQQRMLASKEDCNALRGQLAAEEDKWLEEATEVVAMRRRLANAELDVERAVKAAADEEMSLAAERGRGTAEAAAFRQQLADLQRAAEEDHAALRQQLVEAELKAQRKATAAKQHGRWSLLVLKLQLREQEEAWQVECMRLDMELKTTKDEGAERELAVQNLTSRMDVLEQDARKAAADATWQARQLQKEEGRSRVEAAEVSALKQLLADTEAEAERSLCKAVQAESAKLHKRFTPIVEESQQEMAACQEDHAAARWQLSEEENKRMAEAAEVCALQHHLAEQEKEARRALHAETAELTEAAKQEHNALRDTLSAEEARRHSDTSSLHDRLQSVELGAQKDLHAGREEVRLRYAPMIEAAEEKAEAHRQDSTALRAAVLHHEQVTAPSLEEERAACRMVKDECQTLQRNFDLVIEKTQQQADAFREDCLALQQQLEAETDRRTKEASEVDALRSHLAKKDFDLEAAKQHSSRLDGRLSAEQERREQEAADVASLRQRLVQTRNAAAEESATVHRQLAPALEASREECCCLWGQLAAEEGICATEVEEVAALRGHLSTTKAEALEAAKRAVQEEGAALHQRLAPLVDASREDCFVLRRQLAVEEGTRAAAAAELSGLRQRLLEVEAKAEEAAGRAASAVPAAEALRQECAGLRGELAVEEGQRSAASAEATLLLQRVSSIEQAENATSRVRLQGIEERCRHLEAQLASSREDRREGEAQAASLQRRLTEAEAGAERAVRAALHEEGTALQQWLAPLLEASQEDCARLRDQLAAEEERRRTKAMEVIQLRQRLAAAEVVGPNVGQDTSRAGVIGPLSPGSSKELNSPVPASQELREACGSLRRRLADEEGRRKAESAELASAKASLFETEADAERGLSLIIEASRADRSTFWQELTAEENKRMTEAAEVSSLRQELLNSHLEVEQERSLRERSLPAQQLLASIPETSGAEDVREAAALSGSLAVQEGRLQFLAQEALCREEACREELAAQAFRLHDEKDELRHELAVETAKHRKELALGAAAQHKAEAGTLDLEAQCAKLKASLAAEEGLRERRNAQEEARRKVTASLLAAPSPGEQEQLGLPIEASLVRAFKQSLGTADEAARDQLEVDIDLEKQVILHALKLRPAVSKPTS